MPVSAELRQQIEQDILGRPEVTQGNMMGTPAYMVRNRMFAYWVPDGLVARLPDRVRREFFDQQEDTEFQGPQGRGQGEWTRIPVGKKKDVEAAMVAVKSAYEYARGGETKKKQKKGKRR